MEAGLLRLCRHMRGSTARGLAGGAWCICPASRKCAPALRQGCEEDLSLFLEEADHFLLSEKPRKKRRHLKNECAATAAAILLLIICFTLSCRGVLTGIS